MEILKEIGYWHWWVCGFILLALETFVPGAFFLWIGISALLVGGIVWLLPTFSIEWQTLVFSLLSIITVWIWKFYLKKNPTKSDQPMLNRRGFQYQGRVLTLNEPIINGLGKVKIDDTTWKVEGPDCPKGTKVKVIDIDGTILKVEPILKDKKKS
jgi:membrane protein implicated in regulation of membrane protease activity